MPSKVTNKELVVTDSQKALYAQILEQAQVDFLLQRTPASEIKQRQGRGGAMFDYVEHGYVTERLNMIFGFNWDLEILDKQILEDEVIVEAKLTVRTPQGMVITKTQFGGADIKRHASGPKMGRPLSIADDYKAAGSDALKKCATLLGIGLDLYGRDRIEDPDEEYVAPAQRQQQSRPQQQQRGQQAPRQEYQEPPTRRKGGDELPELFADQQEPQERRPTDIRPASSMPKNGTPGMWDAFYERSLKRLESKGCTTKVSTDVLGLIFTFLKLDGNKMYDRDTLAASAEALAELGTTAEVLDFRGKLAKRIDTLKAEQSA